MVKKLVARILTWFAGPLRGGVRRGADQGLDRRDAGGRVVRMAGSETDITERKQAEEALRKSEPRFRQVVESLPQLVWTCRADGPCDYLSPQWIRYTGIPEEPQLGYGWLDQLHPDDRERTMAAWQASATHGEGLEVEFRIRRHDGVYRWFRTLAVPLRDDAGNIVKWFGSNTDIQALKEADQLLRESEERLRLALDAAYVISFEWDIQRNEVRRFVSSEPALTATAGERYGTFEEVREIVHPEDRELFAANIQAAMARHDGQYESEFRVVRPDGSVAWLYERGRVERDEQGSPRRLVGLSQDISERKLAEEALNAHRQLLETVVNQMPAAVCLIRGSDLRLRLINPAYQAIAPGKEMLGKTLDELWPETGQDFAAICRRVLETGESHQAVDELNVIRRHPDGPLEPAYFSWSLHRVRLAGDEGWGLVDAAWETTARRQTEEALRASEARLKLAQTSAGAGMWDWDIGSGVLEWSAELFRLFGLDPERDEAGFEVWRNVLHPDDRALAEQRIEAAVADHAPLVSEYRIVLPLGTVRWIDARGQATYGADGAPLRMSGICVDVTERKQAEENVRQSRKDLDRAQEVGQIGSWRLDVRRNILAWSDESHRIFGVPKGTPLSYETFLGAVHPDDRAYVDERWNAGLRGEPYDIEHRIVADGRIKWVREKAYLEFDADGTLLGGFGITQDITDRKRGEQQVRESLAEKELLLREIHHRVKNNLQVVSSLVSLQATALAEPALREVFGELRDRVRSMALIHEKLYESGGLAKLNFADYVASLMHSIWSAHGVVGTRVKLRLEVEPVAVSVATAVPCGLILNELASNALKHAFPSDGGEVTVGLRREPATGRLRLWVRDNGVGLPADLDWRRARSLGLRLVQMLARQLEGTVETGPGPGTEFLIRFVAVEAEEVPGLTDAASSTTSGGRA